MLGKLFKYDMRALTRVLLPVHAGALGAGLLACGAGMVGYWADEVAYSFNTVSSGVELITLMAVLVLVLCVMLVACAPMATLVVAVHRFYKNLFTDEGYLTLTLPVRASSLVASKVLAGLLWLAIDGVVVGVALLLVSFGVGGFDGTVRLDDTMPVWIANVAGGSGLFFDDPTPLATFSGSFTICLQAVAWLMVAYASFALGACWAKRHKVAAGVGLFVGIMWLVGLVGGIVNVMVIFSCTSAATTADARLALDIMRVLGWFGNAALIAGAWAVTVHVLGRKVNLP